MHRAWPPWVAALLVLGCQSIEQRGGVIAGQVLGSGPVRGAIVEVWRLDPGGQPAGAPLYRAETGEDGRYRIEVFRLAPPFLVTARGGVTGEYWSADTLALDQDRVHHLRAVIDDAWLRAQREVAPVALTPLTTVAAALAEQRLAEGLASSHGDAVAQAYALLDQHFGIDTRHALPPGAPDGAIDADARHALALAGLSGIVHGLAIQTGRSINAMNIFMLTDALVADARGPGARLDGVGPAGPVALGACGAACPLPADALRRALAEALVRDWLPSAGNQAGLGFGDIAELLLQITGSPEPALFGEAPADELDTMPPAVEALLSPVLDERRDRIAFDDTGRPVHDHDGTEIIDLGLGLGDTCPAVFKHADLLHAMDSNPLRWRFAVRDDLVGVQGMDITATVQPPGGAAQVVVPVAAVQAEDALTLDVAVSAAVVPSLATTEGVYTLSLRARDALGNEAAPLMTCWEHMLLAAPLRADPFEVALGPGSFDAARLEGDNLAPVLRGEVQPVLARFALENNTGADVYLTLRIDELAGRYQAEWLRSRAFLREEVGEDDCLDQQTCSVVAPPEPVAEILGPVVIPPSFAGVRVVEQGSGREAACAACDPGEVLIAAGGRYEVQVVVSEPSFLSPPGVQPAQIAEIAAGPIGSAARLTGVDEGVYVECTEPDDMSPGVCGRRNVFQLYRAMTTAVIEIDRLVLSAQSSALSGSPPQPPLPAVDPSQDSTLSEPISTSFTWTTAEDATLPDPG